MTVTSPNRPTAVASMRRIDYFGYLIDVRIREEDVLGGNCCWIAGVWVSKPGLSEDVRLRLEEVFPSENAARTAGLIRARQAISSYLAGKSDELAPLTSTECGPFS